MRDRARPSQAVAKTPDRDLLALLLAPADRVHAVVDRYGCGDGMPAWIDQAIAWGVAPAVWRRLRQRPTALAEPAIRQLEAGARVAESQALRLAARGAAALGALLAAGIPAATFKGLAQLARTRSVPQRAMGDVDLLVAEERLADAVAVLASAGFALAIPGSLREYRDFIRDAPHFSGNRAVALVDAAGYALDLHWGFGSMCGPALAPEAVLARSVEARLFGTTIRRVSRTDGLLLTAHHALRENFTPAAVTKNLVDLAALCDEPSGEPADRSVLAAAGTPATALAACVTIIARLTGGECDGDVRQALDAVLLPASRRRALDLADIFARQVDAPPLNRDVLHLLHSATFFEVLRSGVVHPLRSRRFMTAIDGAPLASRLRHLLAALGRINLVDLRLYRRLALAKRLPADV